MVKAYKIICKTDGYHARRSANFSREGIKVMAENLLLRDAQKELLSILNAEMDYVPYFKNWGQAVTYLNRGCNNTSISANKTYSDGTRSFTHDVYTYSIEEDGEKSYKVTDICDFRKIFHDGIKHNKFSTGEITISRNLVITDKQKKSKNMLCRKGDYFTNTMLYAYEQAQENGYFYIGKTRYEF